MVRFVYSRFFYWDKNICWSKYNGDSMNKHQWHKHLYPTKMIMHMFAGRIYSVHYDYDLPIRNM